MVRPNTVLPVGEREDRPDYDYADGVNLHVYELEDGRTASTVNPTLNGEVAATFTVQRQGRMITVKRQGTVKRWQVLLVGVQANVEAVGGGRVKNNSRAPWSARGWGVMVTIRLAE